MVRSRDGNRVSPVAPARLGCDAFDLKASTAGQPIIEQRVAQGCRGRSISGRVQVAVST